MNQLSEVNRFMRFDPYFKYAFMACIFFLTSLGFAQEIKVNVTLLPEKDWGDKDRVLIQEAAEKAFRNLAKAEVANCGYRNSSKENKDQLRKKWGNSIPVINKSRKVSILIHKKQLGSGVLGQARVGVSRIERDHYTIQNLEIDLSKDAIHSTLNKNADIEDRDKWVNVISHEVAHNMGFKHGTGSNWSENYPGYFVTEIGFCAMTDGRYGSKKR